MRPCTAPPAVSCPFTLVGASLDIRGLVVARLALVLAAPASSPSSPPAPPPATSLDKAGTYSCPSGRPELSQAGFALGIAAEIAAISALGPAVSGSHYCVRHCQPGAIHAITPRGVSTRQRSSCCDSAR